MSTLPLLEVHSAAILQGSLQLSIELSGDWQPDTSGTVTDVLKVFCRVGELGGYRGSPPTASASSLLLSGTPVFAGPIARFMLVALNLDPRAFQFLRQQLAFHEYGDPAVSVRRVLVHQTATSDPTYQARRYPPIDDENDEDSYPEPIRPLPFSLKREDNWQKAHRLEVELKREVTANDVSQLEVFTGAWSAQLEQGAFNLPVSYPDELESVGAAVSQFDQYALEIEVPVFLASDVAWEVLLNLLASAANAGLPVVEVLLE